MKAALIPVPDVDFVWPQIAAGIKESVERCDSDLSVSYLWQLCRSGQAFLIIGADETGVRAVTIHRFERYRSGWKLCCLATWGPGWDDWFEAMTVAAGEVARNGDADEFISEGSRAYLRKIPGAKEVRTLFKVPI